MNKSEHIDNLQTEIIAAFDVALQDMITPNLVGVIVDWTDVLIFGAFIYDGALTDVEEEIVWDVEAEVISHFNDHTIDLVAVGAGSMIDIKRLDRGIWVYRRP